MNEKLRQVIWEALFKLIEGIFMFGVIAAVTAIIALFTLFWFKIGGILP